MTAEVPLHRALGLTDEELDAIRGKLDGREPNGLELAMFSVMWSEHCSYKSSRPLLKTLPTTGEDVVVPWSLVADTVNVKFPASTGVPEIRPLAESIDIPSGNAPDAMAYLGAG